ncbi:hypothetical protein cand_034140 [Cryptosporidium andersoni]|uniref:Sec1 family protein n=1 Tax=Cryptosporidium andersoni TaxID=117008 RepID=A0A1J4MZ29_9CRYT|nr:hypothetical protein cand_034140 [Cryptosporidium andersoni]
MFNNVIESFESLLSNNSEGVDILFTSDSVKECLVAQNILPSLIYRNLYYLDWDKYDKILLKLKKIGSIASINFVYLEPIIYILKDRILRIIEYMNKSLITRDNIKVNIIVPYSSNILEEYTKLAGIDYMDISPSINLTNFDFKSITKTLREKYDQYDINIVCIKSLFLFFCNSSSIYDRKRAILDNINLNTRGNVHLFCTCKSDGLFPILEDDIDEIYKSVILQRRNTDKLPYEMPILFSPENIKKNLNLLELENLPFFLRDSYSKHIIQIMTFIMQISGNKSSNYTGDDLNDWIIPVTDIFSLGPSSRIVATHLAKSCRRIAKNRNFQLSNIKLESKDTFDEKITLVIMDRTMDFVSPIFSPVSITSTQKDLNVIKFNEEILEYLDKSTTYKPDKSNIDISSVYQCEESTDPTVLSVLLDPDKLQKDLILSDQYPVISFQFIAILRDFLNRIKNNKDQEISCDNNYITRILMCISSPLYQCNRDEVPGWIKVLTSINQSNISLKLWNQISNDYKDESSRFIILKDITNNLAKVFDIELPIEVSIRNYESPENDFIHILEILIYILEQLRFKLMPPSVVLPWISKPNNAINNYDTDLDTMAFISSLHIFLLPIIFMNSNPYFAIFSKHLRRKFTCTAFETINANKNGVECMKSDIMNILTMAISCACYEGPDCRLSSFNINIPQIKEILKLQQRLLSIRSCRSSLKHRSFRNFSYANLLAKSNPYSSLIAQIIADIMSKNSKYLDDLYYLQLSNTNAKDNHGNSTIILNIIGDISLAEIHEIQILLDSYKKNIAFNFYIICDNITSPYSLSRRVLKPISKLNDEIL